MCSADEKNVFKNIDMKLTIETIIYEKSTLYTKLNYKIIFHKSLIIIEFKNLRGIK